jgi:adenine phosphoribosyltransferase
MNYITEKFCEYYKDTDIDLVAGTEARGLIFASVVAKQMHKGLIMLRKKGKLPGDTHQVQYELEYNFATLEIQHDLVKPGQRVLIVDDLLATGGTSSASAKLVEKMGGVVAGFAFVVELAVLKGRKNIDGYKIVTLVRYE